MARIDKTKAAEATQRGVERFNLLERLAGTARLETQILKDLKKAAQSLSEALDDLLLPEKAETLSVLAAWLQESTQTSKTSVRRDLVALAEKTSALNQAMVGRIAKGRPRQTKIYRLVYCVANEWYRSELPISSSQTSALVAALMPEMEKVHQGNDHLDSLARNAIQAWEKEAKKHLNLGKDTGS
ncbi:MAG: hypothetical protein O3C03_06560 [Proteobacteria bacterium]|nr:hypothetical protein [Pseudomonadota bacterium]MDA0868846.1 hypothetical protein [Pseudomonadota bacterium]MDA1328581.1 hypothetical protein [Pseudomonadota bacterium]